MTNNSEALETQPQTFDSWRDNSTDRQVQSLNRDLSFCESDANSHLEKAWMHGSISAGLLAGEVSLTNTLNPDNFSMFPIMVAGVIGIIITSGRSIYNWGNFVRSNTEAANYRQALLNRFLSQNS